jgi:hypothetical protein
MGAIFRKSEAQMFLPLNTGDLMGMNSDVGGCCRNPSVRPVRPTAAFNPNVL